MREIIFGKRAVFEAIENDIQIDKIFMDRDSQYMDNIKRKIIFFTRFNYFFDL